MNIKETIKKLTIDEKISLLEGKDSWQTRDISRIGLPSIMMTDGPHGIRKEKTDSDKIVEKKSEVAISFPTASTIACSFDKELAYKMGKAIGEEARQLNVAMVLGPGVNIKRHPLCGRNFEYYSEDPLVAAIMGESFINGIQSNNVGACVKHYCCNSQERLRFTIDSIVDERALREIYLKAFKRAVDNNVAAVMCAYNKINGVYASENKYLLTDILRNEWGYKGLLVTDWGATNDRTLGLLNGQDLEMPSSNGYNLKKVKDAYIAGKLTNENIDKSIARVLELVDKYYLNKTLPCSFEEHHTLAATIAAKSSVLLKNDNNILPIKNDDNIALIGLLAEKPRFQGGGSSYMNPFKVETILEEIPNYIKNFKYAAGYSLEKDGLNNQLIDEAVKVASEVHKVLLVLGLPEHYETEGCDREKLELPLGQLELVDELLKVNKNIAVVLVSGSVVSLPFNDKVKAILYSGLGGEAASIGILDNVFGKVNPSGRLTETFAYNLDDYITNRNFNKTNNSVWYQESIYVGYRYFNTFDKKVMYPFGHGLSYTTFDYKNLIVKNTTITKNKKIKVSVDVVNTGSLQGEEVVMLFVQNNEYSSVYKPKRELRAFEKVSLEPKEKTTVSFELDYEDFSYYDINMHKFHVDEGFYKIQIGMNVEKIILEAEVERKENDSDFVKHQNTCYNRSDKLILKDEDFELICGFKLPPKNIKIHRPFSFASTLSDINECMIGRMINHFIRKTLIKQHPDASEELKENTLKSLKDITIKNVVAFSAGYVSFELFEGLIDLMNRNYIRGLKKLMKGNKNK